MGPGLQEGVPRGPRAPPAAIWVQAGTDAAWVQSLSFCVGMASCGDDTSKQVEKVDKGPLSRQSPDPSITVSEICEVLMKVPVG